jgi:hypothetical protein
MKRKNNKVIPIFIITLFVIIFIIAFIQWFYILPLVKLHTVSDQNFLKHFMKRQLLAVKYPQILNELSSMSIPMTMDFFYTYCYIETKHRALFIVLHRKNRFSDACKLIVYGINYKTDQPFIYFIPTTLNDINIEEVDNTIIIEIPGLLKHTMNFTLNTITYNINHIDVQLDVTMQVEDWNTTQPSFFPWYAPMRMVTDMNGHVIKKPGEWCVDSPCIGKVLNGQFGGEALEPNGTYWFDTYTGTNYSYCPEYTWFLINNDEWIIYLLEFKHHKPTESPHNPILIKNKKQNRWFYVGYKTTLPEPFNMLTNLIDPITLSYTINGNLGGNFEVIFRSKLINIHIVSIPNSIRRVIKYNYYENDSVMNNVSESDKHYYDYLRKLSFEDYVCKSNLTIEYDGKVTTDEVRILYDRLINIP